MVLSETKADLQALAAQCNPAVKFFDPLNLSGQSLWGQTEEASIGFLRHAEIKHGRIAMFAFVGFIVGSNHVQWPWAQTLAGDAFPDAGGVPGAQWDAIPLAAKIQIFGFVALMEFWSEVKKYTREMQKCTQVLAVLAFGTDAPTVKRAIAARRAAKFLFFLSKNSALLFVRRPLGGFLFPTLASTW